MSSGVELIVFPIGMLAMAVIKAGNRAADAAAERQQRRVEAQARSDRALADYDQIRTRVEEARRRYGDAITPIPPFERRELASTDRARAEAALARLSGLVTVASDRLRVEAAAAGTAALLAGLATTTAAKPTTSAPEAPDAPDETADTVRRVLERLDATVPERARDELAARAAAVLAAAPGRAALLADDLRTGVQAANERVAVRRARLAELHARLDRHSRYAVLAGPGADAMDAARRALIRAGDDPDPDWPGLAAAVDAAIDGAVAAVLRDYAAGAVREALEEVGCEVEEEFDVLLVEEGMAHLRRPEWTDLAVRVRQADAQNGQSLRLTLVAPDDAAAPLDATTEEKWCGTVDRLLPALAARELGAEVVERTEPGDGYVQPVARARFPFGADDEERTAGRRRAIEPQRRAARP